jgi:hypothetical protein
MAGEEKWAGIEERPRIGRGDRQSGPEIAGDASQIALVVGPSRLRTSDHELF